MDYLPNDPNEFEPKNLEKNEKKLKEFREYLVDKGVVLSFVKGKFIFIIIKIVLLSLKYSENRPKNPIKSMREFFGKYHDTRWDEIEALKEEIIVLNQENPKLMEKVLLLEQELEYEKRQYRLKSIYRAFEIEKGAAIGTKTIVERLTGNKKYDIDEKLFFDDFVKFVESVAENEKEIENQFLDKLELSNQGQTVFKDDQDNLLYKRMINILKDMKKNSVTKAK